MELRNGKARAQRRIQRKAARLLKTVNLSEHTGLKLTQLHIRNLQEVPRAARRIADRIEVDTGVCGARMTQMGRNPLPTR
ncbi:hypothetical protein HMPREF2609_00220 [Rothia sp. HMSC058E10]|nr:hypothetical protein HMPREF2609_00220 [Rothia sp. HMSC058E10]